MDFSSRQEKQKARVILDPRTKLLLLLTINVVMLSPAAEGSGAILEPIMAVLAALLFLKAGKGKIVFIYIILYALASQAGLALRVFAGTSVVGFLVRFFAQILTRMTPGVTAACYVVAATSVSEFIAAMERMHVSQKIIIPFAVMFRFFPTIGDEIRSIQDAMRLRSIGWKRGPVAMLEYRFVPLIISVVRIGDELSAAAVTRGLGGPIRRTNYCKIGFSAWDFACIAFLAAVLGLYFVFLGAAL